MGTYLHREEISTLGDGQVIDLTGLVEEAVTNSGLTHGTVTAFAMHSTVGITTMEHEPGTDRDLAELFHRLVPTESRYHHNRLNADTNGHAHAQAALLGPSVTVPFQEGKLLLGTWQSIVAVDFDDRPRTRQIAVHVQGD